MNWTCAYCGADLGVSKKDEQTDALPMYTYWRDGVREYGALLEKGCYFLGTDLGLVPYCDCVCRSRGRRMKRKMEKGIWEIEHPLEAKG